MNSQPFSHTRSTGLFRRARTALLLALLSGAAPCALSADISPPDLATLHRLVNRTGLVRVMVTLAKGVHPMNRSHPWNAQAEGLYAELGASAFPTGRWTNGMGEIGFYTDLAGLGVLASTSNAVAFGPDPTDKGRARAYDQSGSLEAIDDALVSSSPVAIDMVLNTAEPAYTVQKDGATRYHGPSEVNDLLDRVLAEPYARGIQGVDRRLNPGLTPIVAAKVDREAFYGLRDSVHIRALRLQGPTAPQKANWSDDALEVARKIGQAEISILLRGGASQGFALHMPTQAYQHQMNANTAALREILADAGFGAMPPLSEAEAGMGQVSVMASFSQITRLYANRDPRVLSIDVNKALAVPASASSPMR